MKNGDYKFICNDENGRRIKLVLVGQEPKSGIAPTNLNVQTYIKQLQNEIARLNIERDEARMSVCRLTSRLNKELGAETLSPKQTAIQLGWEYLFWKN